MVSNDNAKRSSGKFSDHFAFKVNTDGKVKDGDKINCLHCNKQFVYCCSNTAAVVTDSQTTFSTVFRALHIIYQINLI